MCAQNNKRGIKESSNMNPGEVTLSDSSICRTKGSHSHKVRDGHTRSN